MASWETLHAVAMLGAEGDEEEPEHAVPWSFDISRYRAGQVPGQTRFYTIAPSSGGVLKGYRRLRWTFYHPTREAFSVQLSGVLLFGQVARQPDGASVGASSGQEKSRAEGTSLTSDVASLKTPGD